MIRRPPRSTQSRSSAASDVYKRQKQMYDAQQCAGFLADFIEYEPLADPTHLPPHIISPNTVLQWRKGDCFDMAITLCSILLGGGYDAYCVSGYAPKRVCLADETRYQCPLAQERKVEEQPEEKSELEEMTGYKLKPIPDLTSKYDLRKKKEAEEATRVMVEEEEGEDWAALIRNDDAEDELHGIRVHAWVLVLEGQRGVTSGSFYIEPATGTSYPVNQSPYLAVESVWNNHNYWANMQDCSRGIDTLQFDLMNTTNWEYVLSLIHISEPTRPY
eukprot:TRINITY_DN949_c0_g1_i2.p1 TRINITY_DN949_c0_g1~~TRINITY_DN949_c0_g1_i2.p1  ORF type:complete len:274 (+),score=117.95 TRINITY_DN949_c0_g1_i2:93-914(+)